MTTTINRYSACTRGLHSDGQQTASLADADWPRAIIAGAYRTGVLGVRSLVRRNVHATLFDCDPAMPGFRSVYGPSRLCPNPDSDPDAWERFMLDLATEYDRPPVLIASADQFVTAIFRHAEVLRAHYVLSSGIALHGALAEKRV